jgi:DNA-binding NarL/FixJ family response regulator
MYQMETVLIADDHQIVRHGIRMLLERFPTKYQFIEVHTCTEVAQILSRERVHHAILDMVLTDGNILSVIDHIERCSHQTNILVYSMNAEHIYARRLIEKGVRGFLCKQNSIEELEKAIRCLVNGQVYLSAELKETLLKNALTATAQDPIDGLSNRELEVMEYLAIGMGTKEIAGKMNLDITTISTYRRRAFEKLEVQNVIEMKEKFLLHKMLAG